MQQPGLSSDYSILSFTSLSEFESWMRINHATVNGIWVKFFKKSSKIPTVTYLEALEVALCHGWIDGQSKSVDDTCYLQKFTPRRAKSMWSKRNVDRVTRLIEQGRMQPAGQQQIDEAKADGRFAMAYDPPSEMQFPVEFIEKLQQNPKAQAFFNTLNKSNQYAIAWRLQTAKREKTRLQRMDSIIQKLQNKELFHPKAV